MLTPKQRKQHARQAQRKWAKSHKEAYKHSFYKSKTYKFVDNMASANELKHLISWAEERLKMMKGWSNALEESN